MNLGILFRLLICLGFLGGFLYLTIDRQNEITKMRFAIPRLVKVIDEIKEENTRLKYQIECFENPVHLMQLARLNEYCHLKHPMRKEILTVREGDPIALPEHPTIQEISLPSKLSLAAILTQYAGTKAETQ